MKMITAEEAKENVRLHSIGVFHTEIKLCSDQENNYEDLLEIICWAVRRESHAGHSMISILVNASTSVEEAIDIYKMAEFLKEQGFVTFVSGSVGNNQVELIVKWCCEEI